MKIVSFIVFTFLLSSCGSPVASRYAPGYTIPQVEIYKPYCSSTPCYQSN